MSFISNYLNLWQHMVTHIDNVHFHVGSLPLIEITVLLPRCLIFYLIYFLCCSVLPSGAYTHIHIILLHYRSRNGDRTLSTV